VVEPQEEDCLVSYARVDFSFNLGMKKILFYYLGYSTLFFIIHLSLISTVTFFHFLIDHDMHVIENWLFTNAWEIIIVSKVLAVLFVIQLLKLNNYFVNSLIYILKEDIWKPSREALVFIIFEFIFFLSFIIQSEIQRDKIFENFSIISFLGLMFFYLSDFIVLNILFRNIFFKKRVQLYILILSLIAIFMLFSEVTLSLTDRYAFFIGFHFLTILIFLLKERKNIANALFYTIFIAGPLSSLYGFRLIGGGSDSLQSVPYRFPVLLMIGIVFIGILYYSRRVKS